MLVEVVVHEAAVLLAAAAAVDAVVGPSEMVAKYVCTSTFAPCWKGRAPRGNPPLRVICTKPEAARGNLTYLRKPGGILAFFASCPRAI